MQALKVEMKVAFQMSDHSPLSFYLGNEVHGQHRDYSLTVGLRQACSGAGRTYRLQPSSHPDGGQTEAES
jgi:hypothetical protein